MKLIIDIDDELVETARFAVHLDMGSDYVKSIANGIPLDKIRAEIEALNEKVSVDYKMCLDKSAVLQIIDKYRNGVSK
jgi:hypothetical protein